MFWNGRSTFFLGRSLRRRKEMTRPREFDERAALDAAVAAFWAKGYEGTSTRDLTACTGLSPSSMYAAFGDKRTFFRRALDHYLDRTLRDKIARLEAAASPGLAIAGFFDDVVERSIRDKLWRGCMLVNSALTSSPEDAELQTAIGREFEMIEGFFHRCLVKGQQTGEIPATYPADDSARQLLSVLLGIRVLARVRPERALLTGAVGQALKMQGLPWPLRGASAPAPDRRSLNRALRGAEAAKSTHRTSLLT
jgi:TetR/AcrR family transcriptional regulator, transcriptional repressor for nem operon